MGYVKERGFDSRHQKQISLSSTASRPVLGSQLVPETLPPKKTGESVKLTTHLHPVPRI
jgi:hypothetical protein